ncbi:MAG TPA: hypothetical protein VMT45_13445 [Thermoanaerobaculaceae bacterium]|nr:hypothetical protein [Thermoanaerobaculaceae bacterium]
MRLPRRAAVLALLLAAAGCRHVAPPAPLPRGWEALVAKPPAFAALYRLDCCGRRDLILTVRAGDGRLLLNVAVPPGGMAMAAWVEDAGGWVNRLKAGCREAFPRGVVPVSETTSLPLDPGLATLLLAGLIPAGARELPELPGLVEATTEGFVWRVRVEGPEPHCTRVVVARPGEGKPVLVADLESPSGPVSGAPTLVHGLSLVAGSVKAKLTLQAWHTDAPPSPPPWLSAPVCGAKP